ncbi:MAG: alpha-amylase family glycosyl hydrolase [Weeksellaceae bacterium]|nr:alpha-amylase family glycosyl hydrolase [Weeksellaceae bacterium]
MKKIFYFLMFCAATVFAQQQTVSYTVTPEFFEENQQITITIDGASVNEALWGVTNNALYLWAWSYDQNLANSMDSPTNGTWANSNEANRLTYNSANDTYSISFVPTTFFNRTNIGRIGFLIKAKNGTGDKKSQDIFLNVGGFQMNLHNPQAGSTLQLENGQQIQIQASSSQASTFEVLVNNVVVYTSPAGQTSLNYDYTVTNTAQITVRATNASNQSIEYSFNVVVSSVPEVAAMPAYMRQGYTPHPTEAGKAGFAIWAPHKSFVHLIGSFNSYGLSDEYLMKRDTEDNNLFWIEVEGLNNHAEFTYQYRTNDNKRVADPYSELVLSPYDDPWISSATYPNLPEYPAGQDFEVSYVNQSETAYNWNVSNFEKPAKENLVIYELLVRDFTEEQTWQSLIDKMPYFNGLNINAIELMPIMEFDGNNSWGYNPSFHYALDKAYGTRNKFKEFVDICHQNGIAVILDIALNHATGRNPLVRLWNIDPDGDGFGTVAPNNPYFNQTATHAYGVFEDFNHQQPMTQYYTKRVIQHWIQEYKIDGFRWDLTKGFTQNCSAGNEACTNAYQQDRVDVLRYYADRQWEADATSYVIFEHLGTDNEEQQWANYRNNEGKGILMWNIMNSQYNQNTMGFAENSNIGRAHHMAHGFNIPVAKTYAESHDEERIMFRNLNYGAQSGGYNVRNLETALERQESLGAILFTTPGPKMLWQFGELGYDFSINRCEDGTINNNCRTAPKPVAFTLNYHNQSNRAAVYDTWSKLINLRVNEDVFNTTTYIINSGNLLPRIHVWKESLPSSTLRDVIVVANFTLNSANVAPQFPYTGTWYDLMTNDAYTVSAMSQEVNLPAGQFRIFGNRPTETLAASDAVAEVENSLVIIQNPVKGGLLQFDFAVSDRSSYAIYDMSGKLITQNSLATQHRHSVNVKLNSGAYILVVEQNGKIASSKFVVQ